MMQKIEPLFENRGPAARRSTPFTMATDDGTGIVHIAPAYR